MNGPEVPVTVDVVVIGGGPAGLTAAHRLATLGVHRVVVIEREEQAGGIPRHSFHQGYGLRDLRRTLTGPQYAQALVRRARDVGVEVQTGTTVTSVDDDLVVATTSRSGRGVLHPRAVLFATGARERPRAARLVAGSRPAGVFTTGQLQQWVGLHHLPVGERAVVIGAEHVAYSAVLTLRHANVKVVALLTDLPRQQSARGAAVLSRYWWGAPTVTNARVVALHGKERVTSIDYEDLTSGRIVTLACDTVVFTGDWIPDVELARRSGVDADPRTKGPSTDEGGRTSRPGMYAAGNLVHPVETADRTALNARRIADVIARDLVADSPASVPVLVEPGLHVGWLWPTRVTTLTARQRLAVRFDSFTPTNTIEAIQAGNVVATRRLRRIVPGQHYAVPLSWLRGVDPAAGPVTVRARPTRP